MKRIGILSDTHSFWDDQYLHYFEACDEVWHAGDICSVEIIEKLAEQHIVRAVCGNCDAGDLRYMFPNILRWKCEGVEVLMKHIGGRQPNYDPSIRKQLIENPPKLFITGHSHILNIEYDKKLGMLHINPGAAGIQGWQKKRTMVRLTIDNQTMRDCEVVTLS